MRKNILFILILNFLFIALTSCQNTKKDNSQNLPANRPQITLLKIASGFKQPTDIVDAGDGSGRLFVTEKKGIVRIIKNGAVSTTPFLDISDRVLSSGSEQGLLSIVFPPEYSSKGYFYVNYTARSGDGDTRVSRFRIIADPDKGDPASEEILLTVDQPYANHNGGQLLFGADRYLYIGMGDGGSAGDPSDNAQNPQALLGKILRIDVESDLASGKYKVPPDNPFISEKNYRPEIWATGLRNPWKFSFDSQTKDLYIADVGQNSYEEINFQPATSKGGENYGWNIMEASHCFKNDSCIQTGMVLPVTEYDHAQDNCSVTGGKVYRGEKYPDLQGMYLYGDFCSGIIWGLKKSGNKWESGRLLDTSYSISTFGSDIVGNIYLADYSNGDIYLIAS